MEDVVQYHFKYFQNNPILKSKDYTNPPTFQLWKFTLAPGEVVSLFIYFFFR